MAQQRQFSVGADPELFLRTDKGRFISAHDKMPGTKLEPYPAHSGKGAMQVDGTAAEFNINPCVNEDQFADVIRSVVKDIQTLVQNNHPEIRLVAIPTVKFTPGYFKKLPESARALGCSPDYNVYTGEVNPSPDGKKPIRTGGGHVHLGWTTGENPDDSTHIYDCSQMVENMDASLYLMSLLWDEDRDRRSMYGTMGTYRPKPYGVEYRPLSNAWVADPDLHRWVFNSTIRAAELIDEDRPLQKEVFPWSLIDQINEHGNEPERAALLDYHEFLVGEYGFPALPTGYTEA